MIYSDEELKRWWAGLGERGRLDVLATMIEKMEHSDFALSLASQYEQRRRELSPKQIAAIRKWASE